MNDTKRSPTKALFESLAKLYKQGSLLLMDSDRLMEEQGWVPRDTTAPAEFSNSLNSPERWYARWATRFYMRRVPEGNEVTVDRLLFVSIHFASDHDTDVSEPLVCAGRLLYKKLMTDKETYKTYNYWNCKYWFFGKPHDNMEGWHKTEHERLDENLKSSETFAVPLYDITSSEKLKELIINRLLAGQE